MVLPCYDPLCFLPLIQPLGKERSSNIDAFLYPVLSPIEHPHAEIQVSRKGHPQDIRYL